MDHLADVNLVTLHEISRQHELPAFVKSARAETISGEPAQLPAGAYADPAHGRFPCHTRADAWLSYAYFLKNAKQLDRNTRQSTHENLIKFAHQWGIFVECQKLQREHEKLASEDLSQLPDSEFAIAEKMGSDTYRALPLLDAECVKAAADHLMEYRERYPMEWRKRAAARILDRAAKFETKLDLPYLHKTAGRYLSSPPDIAEAMLKRARFVDPKHRGETEQLAFLKAARAVAQIKKPNAEVLCKIASVIDSFDAHYKLTRLYHRGLPSPEEIVYGAATVKQASAIKDQIIALTNGSVYSRGTLKRAGLAPYRALGDDIVNAVRDGLSGLDIEKAAAILPTLPRPDADLLDRAMRAIGVKTATASLRDHGVASPFDASAWSSDDWQAAESVVGAA